MQITNQHTKILNLMTLPVRDGIFGGKLSSTNIMCLRHSPDQVISHVNITVKLLKFSSYVWNSQMDLHHLLRTRFMLVSDE
jgi:hypothetical protein